MSYGLSVEESTNVVVGTPGNWGFENVMCLILRRPSFERRSLMGRRDQSQIGILLFSDELSH